MQFNSRAGDNRWLLPEGIEEILPADAARMEQMRRLVLDRFEVWGYRQVVTPLIEYLDALLTGVGHDLDLQTLKLIDQASGRLLGVRADMTPQVARIDARTSPEGMPARFCYLGTVLRAQAHHLDKTRSPMQVGAELYGHAGTEADEEIIRLMLDVMTVCGLGPLHLDLGHVGIFHALARQAALSPDQEDAIFALLQQKARPDLEGLLEDWALPALARQHLLALAELHGPDALGKAREVLAEAGDAVLQALDELDALTAALRHHHPDLPIHFDLTELRGYHYQTGIVFAVFVPGQGREIARGGRYDDVGRSFGCARPATGFSADLRQWLRMLPELYGQLAGGAARVFAPTADYATDPALRAMVSRLRADQQVVIEQLLPGNGTAADYRQAAIALGCSHRLQAGAVAGDWDLVAL